MREVWRTGRMNCVGTCGGHAAKDSRRNGRKMFGLMLDHEGYFNLKLARFFGGKIFVGPKMVAFRSSL